MNEWTCISALVEFWYKMELRCWCVIDFESLFYLHAYAIGKIEICTGPRIWIHIILGKIKHNFQEKEF